MLIGAMNHPMRDLVREIHDFADAGFDFVDITLEPTGARPDQVDVSSVRRTLDDSGLRAVGHTAWYMPIASQFPELRQAATDILVRCMRTFSELDVPLMTVHPDMRREQRDQVALAAANADSIAHLAQVGQSLGVRLMVENQAGVYSQVRYLRPILDAAPAAGFHLDAAHSNLSGEYNRIDELLEAFANRLVHVHMSDNKGGDWDLHLPLGAGNIDWRRVIRSLKNVGYDGTVTLEVFADREVACPEPQKAPGMVGTSRLSAHIRSNRATKTGTAMG